MESACLRIYFGLGLQLLRSPTRRMSETVAFVLQSFSQTNMLHNHITCSVFNPNTSTPPVSYVPIFAVHCDKAPVIDVSLDKGNAFFSMRISTADRKMNMVKCDYHDSASASWVTVTCAALSKIDNTLTAIGQIAPGSSRVHRIADDRPRKKTGR